MSPHCSLQISFNLVFIDLGRDLLTHDWYIKYTGPVSKFDTRVYQTYLINLDQTFQVVEVLSHKGVFLYSEDCGSWMEE